MSQLTDVTLRMPDEHVGDFIRQMRGRFPLTVTPVEFMDGRSRPRKDKPAPKQDELPENGLNVLSAIGAGHDTKAALVKHLKLKPHQVAYALKQLKAAKQIKPIKGRKWKDIG